MADDALLERAAELRTLRAVLASAASGAGGFVAAQGGPVLSGSR